MQPVKNPELPTKRVPIKGLEFFIGTSAWYCKLCDTWIGDLHCASAHFKSKRHNDLYAELIAKEPNWEIDWLTKRTRAFEKSLSQTSTIKQNVIKEDKSKEKNSESKVEKSFFEKEPRKEREKFRDRERDRDRFKKEVNRKTTDLKSQLSPDKESNEANNVSLSDWMKPVDLPVEKSMITLKESVQKSKDRLHKNKIDEFDESDKKEIYNIKKKRIEELKPSPTLHEKKEDNFNLSHRSKIKLPFIGKMPFAKPITKKTNSSAKDIPNFTVESTKDEAKDKYIDSVIIQKMLIEKMISAANEKKIEKQLLPIDMDIDDDNENNEAILRADTDSVETQLNPLQPGNHIHQMYNQPPPQTTNTLPQDLSTALNMIFPCNEASSAIPPINTSVNPHVHNSLIHQQFNMSYDVTNNSCISPERKKKKNAPSQRKRRHMKKIMEKEDELIKDDYDDDDEKLEVPIQGPNEENNKKSNDNESEGDELAMLGIDAGDMAAQYY